jgi:glycerol-3-phosphate dehydrogenase
MLRGRIVGADISAEGEVISIDAGVVVNAAGPWVDHVRRLEDGGVGRR